MKKKPEDLNAEARAALKKRVAVAKPAPAVVNPAPASVFSLLKSTLAKKDTRGPAPAKKKPPVDDPEGLRPPPSGIDSPSL